MSPALVVAIINFNGAKYLKRCIDSLLTQTYRDLHVLFIDNVSTDKSVSMAKDLYGENPKFTIIANTENTGYVGGANQAFSLASEESSRYLMLMNPDIVFEPDYLEKAIIQLEANSKTAAFTGKIRRYDFEKDEKTNFIDTVGLYSFRNRRIVDYGQGQEDQGQFDEAKEVLGISGACPIYRVSALLDISIQIPKGPPQNGKRAKRANFVGKRSTKSPTAEEPAKQEPKRKDFCLDDGACPIYRVESLQDIAIPKKEPATTHEIFDENFFMYKEDIDVSWRLRLRDWSIYYDPSAIAYHGRGTGILKEFSHEEVLKNRRHSSNIAKYHAYKNQRLMQIKNEIPVSFFRDFFPIIWKEILITGYMIFREPRLFKAMFHLIRQIPSALRKRRHIQSTRKVDANHMKKWLHSASIKPHK